MRSIRVLAPAKINWTLEVLRDRPDGYHEIRSIMQTIDFADIVTLHTADAVSLSIRGDDALADEPRDMNLAYRAALALRGTSSRGVYIELQKRIPVAAGLGGGSSDAAAVLRGLRVLWNLDIADDELVSTAGDLGSDVPFFLHGGTAVASGRGETIEPLPDVHEGPLVIAWALDLPDEGKTAARYLSLRQDDYTDGAATEALSTRIRSRSSVRDEDICNVFERVPSTGDQAVLDLRADGASGEPHMCGSGPARFLLVATREAARAMARRLSSSPNMRALAARTISSAEAMAFEDLE